MTLESLRKALASAGGVSPEEVILERPFEMSHGDYATNIAFILSKKKGMNPRACAEEIVAKIGTVQGVDKFEVAGPGFINIILNRSVHTDMVNCAKKKEKEWGKSVLHKGKRIAVEYSCPNPFKEMHVGHLMSTIIGESVSRLIEYSGAKVFRDSYGGDVGPHVAKALWSLRKDEVKESDITASRVGDAYTKGAQAYEENEESKKEIDLLNVAIYKKEDTSLMRVWKRGKEVCLDAFKEIYTLLGTRFDAYFFESETADMGLKKVEEGVTKGIFEKSEGAIIYNGEKKGMHTLVFVTSRGTPTYEAKELGLAYIKEKKVHPDISYILTASEQIGHFAVVKASLMELDPKLARKTFHIPHGFLRLPDGKMSSRKGNVLTATSLIDEVMERAKAKNPDESVMKQVTVGAIKYSILRSHTGKDIIFDIDSSLSFEGDSGPYLQYSYTRAKSILAKAGHKKNPSPIPPTASVFEKTLVRFPEVVERGIKEREPHHVVTYLTELSSLFNAWYANERIIGGEYEGYSLLLTDVFANTMKRGLWLLGIEAPERM